VTAALYLTIWIGLALFAAGETGRRPGGATSIGWSWWTSFAGLLFTATHFVLAFETRHDWSHASAVSETARQTAAVYGLDWGGGVFVNYAFLGVWALDLWRWRVAAHRGTARSSRAVWLARAFYFVVILNGAVIFAAGPRRLLGAVIVLWLLVTWSRTWGPPSGGPAGWSG
jgi:hypothetical protein